MSTVGLMAHPVVDDARAREAACAAACRTITRRMPTGRAGALLGALAAAEDFGVPPGDHDAVPSQTVRKTAVRYGTASWSARARFRSRYAAWRHLALQNRAFDRRRAPAHSTTPHDGPAHLCHASSRSW